MTTPAIPGRLPSGATREGDGIMIGDGPVRIDAFIDFLCPFCRRFELGQAVGAVALPGEAFSARLAEGHYLDWAPYVTARAVALGVEATPTVLVAGSAVRPEPRPIEAAVATAVRAG